MANIGATTAFYKVETSLTRANNEVSKSMERLATGKQNANAGDRSSYVAMADTFRLDYVGTKAGIKGASVAMGYLETGMRVLDSASSLLSRLQELAVLGANNTNTTADNEAINLEAEAIADEFNRLMTTSTYKGKDVFVDAAGDQELAMGGRGSEMSFGIGRISYTDLYSTARTIAGDPNDQASFNLAHLPSDGIVSKSYGGAVTQNSADGATQLTAGKKYVVRGINSTSTTIENDMTDSAGSPSAVSILTQANNGNLTVTNATGANVSSNLASGNVINVSSTVTPANVSSAGVIDTIASGSTDLVGGVVGGVTKTAGTDADRKEGVYTVTKAGSASTVSAQFQITVDTGGTVTDVTVLSKGVGYTAEDLTFTNAELGGGLDNLGAPAADFVWTVNSLTAVANRGTGETINVTSADYSVVTAADGATDATGATFQLQVTGTGTVNVINVTDGGSGFAVGDKITISGSALAGTGGTASTSADVVVTVGAVGGAENTSLVFAEVKSDENAFKSGETYVIQSLGSGNGGTISTEDSDANIISKAFTDVNGNQLQGELQVGQKIMFASTSQTIGGTQVTQQHLDAANALIEGMTFTMSSDSLTSDIEAVQALINTARVQAGSQYAAMESAVTYTTDLTAQYELGFNTVNDVNFSAETAHLAKNQILQQAATAMLAQANSGQQGLLQLIQG